MRGFVLLFLSWYNDRSDHMTGDTTPPPTLEELSQSAPVLVDALAALVRGTRTTLHGCLELHTRDLGISDTLARAHVYHLALDGNGRPLTSVLAQTVAESLIEYAIPRATAQEASRHLEQTGHAGKILNLAARARSLFADLANTGEGGEMFLFALTEQLLGIPQILAKMSLKTNANVHFHGSDGIHATYNTDTERLELYFCESKMYADINAAIAACFESAAPFLINNPTLASVAGHELYLATEFSKIGDPVLAQRLAAALTPGMIAFRSTELCLAAFVGFNANVYPPNVDATLEAISQAVSQEYETWLSTGREVITRTNLVDFRIVVFYVPFDSVQDFRDSFLESVGL